MENQVLESDWKHFRAFRPLFRERFFERELVKLGTIICETGKSYEDRHWELVELMQELDVDYNRAFQYFARSRIGFSLAEIKRQNLITAEEFAGFSPALQDRIQIIQPTLQDDKPF